LRDRGVLALVPPRELEDVAARAAPPVRCLPRDDVVDRCGRGGGIRRGGEAGVQSEAERLALAASSA
jgi:hypothetical protein